VRFRAYQQQFGTGSHSSQLLIGFEGRLGFYLFYHYTLIFLDSFLLMILTVKQAVWDFIVFKLLKVC